MKFFVLCVLACMGIQNSLSAQEVKPAIFMPHQISTSLQERDLAISSTGDTIIFTAGSPDQKIRGLFMIERKNNAWSKPQLLPFSGMYQDIEPFFHPGRPAFYFSSQRPMDGDEARRDYNIWSVSFANGSWGTPQPLDTIINTTKDEFYPSLTADGHLYFTTARPDGPGLEDIYVSRWDNGFQPPEVLDTTVNSKRYEFNAFVAPDESYLIFTSYGRPDGQGGGDLYISRRIDGDWQKAQPMSNGINSTALDMSPYVRDGKLYFTSNRMKKPERLKDYDELKEVSSGLLNGHHNIYVTPFIID